MNMFKGILFSASVLIGSVVMAQDAKAVLDKVSQNVKGYSAMYVEYEMQLNDEKAGGAIASEQGKAWINGEKFKIETPDFHIYTDGNAFWAYSKADNTCTINDYAEIQEDKGFSPSDLFTIWETGFKHEHKGVKSGLTQINLYPTDSENPFHTIVMYIDERTSQIKKAQMKSRDGQEMIYNIKTFTPNPDITENTFKFSSLDYPGVEIDDQRF
jgi:outer membrane lipoprotein-sorting protein